jgi:16S rRNA processing protein RimM
VATASDSENAKHVLIGRVSGVFGTRGWLKVYSYTRPHDNLLTYAAWYLGGEGRWREHRVTSSKKHGPGLVAQLDGISSRDLALELVGCDIAITRSMLPINAAGEYYWADLIGMRVRNLSNVDLGEISQMLATGANDVMVVQGDTARLIPYVSGVYVIDVDSEFRTVLVDWHEDD